MSGVWAGLLLVAVIFGCGGITLAISYHAEQRREAIRRQYAAEDEERAITTQAQHGICQIETYLKEAADQ